MSTLQNARKVSGKLRSANNAAIATFIGYLNSYHQLSKPALKFLKSRIQILKKKKGELLHEAGKDCPNLYFVSEGVLRGYIMDEKREVTTWITSENGFVSSIRSFILQMPTLENIGAIEDCTLLVLHRNDLEQLYALYPEANLAGRRVAELYYAWAESRAFICRISKATDRYEFFIAENGHLINRIPLTYIASYLNMNLETLSRIRTRLSKRKAPAKSTVAKKN